MSSSHTHARTRSASAAALTMTLVAGLAACSDEPDPKDPVDAAEQLATALEKGSLAGAPVSTTTAGDPTEQLKKITRGMKGAALDVTVRSTTDDAGGGKTARLHFRWKNRSGSTWEYDNPVQMHSAGPGLMADWAPSLVHPELRDGETLVAREATGRRGRITGQGEQPIVADRPVYRVGIDRTLVKDVGRATTSARRLAGLVGVDPTGYADQVRGSGPKAFVEAITLRAASVDDAKEQQIDAVPGAVRLEDQLPLAPTPTFAAPVLGKVGPVTKEMVDASGGRLKAGDVAGRSGLQAAYEEQLRGRPSLTVRAVKPGADGPESTRTIYTSPAANGKDLRTTIDQPLQTRAERAISSKTAKPAAVVAIRPSTGEVLAAASSPGSQGYDTARKGRYAPGSTFKVVSSLAMLRAGQTVDGTVQCPATITSNGRVFRNFPEYPSSARGTIPFRTAIANSCNTAMIAGGKKATQPALAGAAATLGMTQDLGQGTLRASVPAQDAGAEHDAAMIGQGRLQATPLSMATVAASVARGATVTPYLLPDHRPKAAPPHHPLTAAEAGGLRSLMRAVVTDGGGKALAGLPGGPVHAKTGTAEYGTGKPPGVNSWMIAYQGDVAVAVLVADGGYGAVACAPIVEALLEHANG